MSKFKVGDIIEGYDIMEGKTIKVPIIKITDTHYIMENQSWFPITDEDKYNKCN